MGCYNSYTSKELLEHLVLGGEIFAPGGTLKISDFRGA